MSSHHRNQDRNTGLGILFWLGVYAAFLFIIGMILKVVGL